MITLIYTLESSAEPNNIRYVGKTIQDLNSRLQEHIYQAKRYLKNKNHYNHNYNWINKELSLGNSIIIKEIDRCDSSKNENWELTEEYWIEQFRIWGFKLNNIQEGGRNNYSIGVPREEMTKQKISKALVGRKLSEKHKENVRKAIIKLQGKPIDQYTFWGKYLKTWDYITQAADFYHLEKANIQAVCCGRKKRSGNFIWRYKEEPLGNIDTSKCIVVISDKISKCFINALQASIFLKTSDTTIRRHARNKTIFNKVYHIYYLNDYKLMNKIQSQQ